MLECADASACLTWSQYTYGNATFVPPFDADADISGLGIAVAFVSTSFITLVFAVAWIVLTASFKGDELAIDELIYEVLRSPALFSISNETRAFWIPIIERVVLNLSDQMILLGLAMLIAAFCLHCTISVYHLTMISDLAWFASNVHLTTLTVLRYYLRDHPSMRNWRALLMVIVAIYLVVLTIWQGHWAWYDSEPFRAQCLWKDMRGRGLQATIYGVPRYWMNVQLGLLGYSYVGTIAQLYQQELAIAHLIQWVYTMPLERLQRFQYRMKHLSERYDGHRSIVHKLRKCLYRLVAASLTIIHILYRTLIALPLSVCVGCAIDIFWFIYGLAWIVQDRSIPDQGTLDGNENQMGFGQIVPILLLSYIVFVFREAYEDQNRKLDQSQKAIVSHAPSGDTSQITRDAAIPFDDTQMHVTQSGSQEDEEDDFDRSVAGPWRRTDTEMGRDAVPKDGRLIKRRKTFPPSLPV